MNSKTIITCALTGVLTVPAVHNVPVRPEEMAEHAEQALRIRFICRVVKKLQITVSS